MGHGQSGSYIITGRPSRSTTRGASGLASSYELGRWSRAVELDCKFVRVETLASPAPPHVFHSAVAKRVSARPVPANKKNPRHQPQTHHTI